MRMKAKKALMTEALVRVALVAIVIFLVWEVGARVGGRLFAKTTDTEKTFNRLVEVIENIKPGELRAVNANTNRGTAILAFAKGSTVILERDWAGDIYFHASTSCVSTKACLCWIKELKYPWYPLFEGTVYEHSFDSEDIECRNFEGINFLNSVTKEEFGAPFRNYFFGIRDEQPYKLTGGFIFGKPKKDYEYFMVGAVVGSMAAKVERYKGIVVVCFKDECIDDDMKKKIDDAMLRFEHEKTKCRVDDTCKVIDATCTCHSGETWLDTNKAPETCEKDQYCYPLRDGCEDSYDQEQCRISKSAFRLDPCEIDETCRAENAPCSCITSAGEQESCLKGQHCYRGEVGCESDFLMDQCRKVLGENFKEPPKCKIGEDCMVTNAPCKCGVVTNDLLKEAKRRGIAAEDFLQVCSKGEFCYESGCGRVFMEDRCKQATTS